MPTASEYKDIGNKHLQAGEFDSAIDAYTKAIELDSSNHIFYSNRSAAYLSKHDAANALKDGESCISLNPSFAKGYSRKGAALHALKNYDAAIEAYEAGLKVAPTDAGLKSGLAEVQKAKDAEAGPSDGGLGGLFSNPQFLMKLFTHPKFGPKMKDPVFMNKLRSIGSNPQLIMSDPEMMEVFQVLLGGMSGGEDDGPMPEPPFASQSAPKEPSKKAEPEPQPEPEEDLNEEEKLVRQKKKRSLEAKERGNALYKEKKLVEALAAYDEAIAIDESNVMFLNNKAAVYIEMGDIDQAISTCEKALEMGATHRISFEDRAKILQRMGAAEAKRQNLAQALAYYKKAQIENFDKAIDRKIKTMELDLKKLEKERYINPELAAEAKERGNAAFRDGNFPVAIKEYEEAVKRDPKNPAYRNNLAASYLKMGLFNDAKKEIEQCLEIDRNYVKAWAKKGDIEMYMKEYHKALDSYRAGLQIEPDNSLCKQGIAKVTEKINAADAQDPERLAHAMADPEIQAIMSDPVMKNILNQLQSDPRSAQSALNDPIVRAKIEKLMAAGILQMR